MMTLFDTEVFTVWLASSSSDDEQQQQQQPSERALVQEAKGFTMERV